MTKIAESVLAANAVLGEGSLWDHRRNCLYWVDILDRKVNIYDPATGANRVLKVGQDVGTVVSDTSGNLVLALRDGFARLDIKSGEVVMIAAQKVPGNRFNDGKCDPAGRFWAGTMAYDQNVGAAALYCLDIDLTVRRMIDNVTISNGLVWTSDMRCFYFIDTPTCEVAAFDYDVDSGNISNRKAVIKIDENLGYPDGMTIDEEDMVWIAHWGGGKVTRWNPKTGELLDTIKVPHASLVTSCAFGGPDLNELFITTATVDLNEEQRKLQPLAGSIFRIRLDVRGVPAFRFKG
ncbi:MAG: SMP-30/gluconolactonase/LRE family protein [Deltaproteobacteria bacterium]|jgi:sugar lactone lactonase YvrE|nr:SMP-30/gluconolactonase/LRE family protein [Deltaproteobacteria bacterium]